MPGYEGGSLNLSYIVHQHDGLTQPELLALGGTLVALVLVAFLVGSWYGKRH